ncbi:zinc finger, C3HC4 type [Oesophagostomum dentatum]|uniref:E3 ubiquitin-protein ligase RNF170 n=1 Tax=Oesophagostomum dentatum TaxID=61180 RepID=A0A0B1SWY3_OESDE|nr:zinc finger, C3HC4 type [Oesophagostomum dentatum]
MFVCLVLLLELVEVTLMMTEANSGQIVEGFSNEALALFTVLLVSFIACTINYFMRNNRVARIHPDLVGDVQGFRESFVRGQSGRVNEARRIAAEGPDSDRTCPICYGNAQYPVLTNCGHMFCCECIMGYWRHSASLISPVKCAICRTEVGYHKQLLIVILCLPSIVSFEVTVLLPLHWAHDEEDDQLRQNNIGLNDYNRRFSGDRPWLEYLYDLPVLIPYILRNLFDFNGLMLMFRLRIFFIAIGILVYILSPFDIIPESAYGFMGLMDDIFVTVLLLVYIAIAVRHFMARRGEAPAE